MKICTKVKKVINKTSINDKIKHYDSIYNSTKPIERHEKRE